MESKKVIAKVSCTEITKRVHWDGTKRLLFTAKMTPVTSNSDENKKFFEATPSGHIELGTFKEDLFTPGKDYIVTFEEV